MCSTAGALHLHLAQALAGYAGGRSRGGLERIRGACRATRREGLMGVFGSLRAPVVWPVVPRIIRHWSARPLSRTVPPRRVIGISAGAFKCAPGSWAMARECPGHAAFARLRGFHVPQAGPGPASVTLAAPSTTPKLRFSWVLGPPACLHLGAGWCSVTPVAHGGL